MVHSSETRWSTAASSPHPNDTELISWSPAKVRQSITRIIGENLHGPPVPFRTRTVPLLSDANEQWDKNDD
jgi:hypothetical protein